MADDSARYERFRWDLRRSKHVRLLGVGCWGGALVSVLSLLGLALTTLGAVLSAMPDLDGYPNREAAREQDERHREAVRAWQVNLALALTFPTLTVVCAIARHRLRRQ